MDILNCSTGIQAEELAQKDSYLASKALSITLSACRPIEGPWIAAEHDMAARCCIPGRAPFNFPQN